jgi:hypothetical protein
MRLNVGRLAAEAEIVKDFEDASESGLWYFLINGNNLKYFTRLCLVTKSTLALKLSCKIGCLWLMMPKIDFGIGYHVES